MPDVLFFEDLRIGDRWISPSRNVTKSDVTEFAELTGDFNPLHTDEEFAKETPFGQPIAHGLLGLAFVAGLSSQSPLVETAAFLGVSDWKFMRPVYFGDMVHVVTEITHAEPHGRKRGRVVWRRTLVNQKGDAVQSGTFETLVSCRKTIRTKSSESRLTSIAS